MAIYLVLGGAITLIAISIAALLMMGKRGAAQVAAIDFEWLEDFSPARYRPMERLLLEDDIDFLRRQPGFRPELIAKLRADRSRVFAAYLQSLIRDFDRLYVVAKQAVLHSPEGVDLCGALARNRAVFVYAVMKVRVRLVMYRLGWSTVDVGPLIASLDALMTDIRALQPAVGASAA